MTIILYYCRFDLIKDLIKWVLVDFRGSKIVVDIDLVDYERLTRNT